MVASVFNLLPYLNLFMKDKKMKQIHTMLDKEKLQMGSIMKKWYEILED